MLGIDEAKISAHHLFKPNKVNEARKVLQALWVLRGLQPQPNKLHVVNNIIATRSLRHGNYRMITDILEFLQLEDPRLNVTFFTLHCEDIPSKVTEESAVRDVLILLEKNE